ncbi:MAG: hypothetical protein QXH71_00600 [Candidatus Anstonellaceae archaeon]
MDYKFFFLFFIFLLFGGCLIISQADNTPVSNPLELKNQSTPNTINLTQNNSENVSEQRSKIIENTNYDLEICQNISTSSQEKIECYISNAIKLDDPSVCYLIEYGENFSMCLSEWCLKTNKRTLSDCEKYSDASRRLICLNNCLLNH